MLWNSAALALATALLLKSESWTAELKSAVTLNRKGEYRQALSKYTALLSTAPTNADAEIHAYVLSQMADAEMELGAYSEAKTKARDALRILASAHGIDTSTFAIAEGI